MIFKKPLRSVCVYRTTKEELKLPTQKLDWEDRRKTGPPGFEKYQNLDKRSGDPVFRTLSLGGGWILLLEKDRKKTGPRSWYQDLRVNLEETTPQLCS